MKIVTFWHSGTRHVGRLSAAGDTVTPLALGEQGREFGALALVERMAAGLPARRRGPGMGGQRGAFAPRADKRDEEDASQSTRTGLAASRPTTVFHGRTRHLVTRPFRT